MSSTSTARTPEIPATSIRSTTCARPNGCWRRDEAGERVPCRRAAGGGVARPARRGAHRPVIGAEGRDTRGQGNASAIVTASLQPDGDGTRVNIDSDVTITGKVSQFGRGVIGDVSAKLLDQFVASLER